MITVQADKYNLNLKADLISSNPPCFLWHEVEDEICLNDICSFNDESSIDRYAKLLIKTKDYIIPLKYTEKGYHRIIPRGAVTRAWLAINRLKDHIITLIQAGAVPDKEFTMIYHENYEAWEYLEDIYKKKEKGA